MRNLKRALSLVLAVVMVIGLMVVGASAVSYNDLTDKDEIVNKDAVSMLVALDIIQGKPDGSYAPTENVDRAQMAKMLSVIMNKGVDNAALYENVSSDLTDIDGNWAKGHINYCYTTGIIAGRGAGIFDPNADVTALEAAKMLLVAIGYDPTIEGFVGTDWALNVSAMADSVGIFRNFTKDLTAPLSRDDAALLIYNALDVEMIQQYSNGYALTYADHRTILSDKYGVIRVEGVVTANEWATLGADKDEALREGLTRIENPRGIFSTTTNTQVDSPSDRTTVGTFEVSTPVDMLGKTVTMYVKKTTILANSTVYGDPVLSNDNVVITSYANVDNGTGDGSLKKLLRDNSLTVNEDTEYFLNYGQYDPSAKNPDPEDRAFNNTYNVKGADLTIIDNDDDGIVDYVLSLEKTMTDVTKANADRGEISLKGVEDTIETDDDYEAGDVVLFVEYGNRYYVELADYITGEMELFNVEDYDNQYIRVDGEKYEDDGLSVIRTADITKFDVEECEEPKGVQFDTTYNFYLDNHGYVTAFKKVDSKPDQYALVLDSSWSTNNLDTTAQVKLLLPDGTESKYAVNWDASAKNFTYNSYNGKTYTEDEALKMFLGNYDYAVNSGAKYPGGGHAAGNLVAYTINEDNEVTISLPDFASMKNNADKAGRLINNGSSSNYTLTANDPGDVLNDIFFTKGQTYLDADLKKGDVHIYLENADGTTANYGISASTVVYYYDGEEGSVVTGYDNMARIIEKVGDNKAATIDGNNAVYASVIKKSGITDVAAAIVIYTEQAQFGQDEFVYVARSYNVSTDDYYYYDIVTMDGTVLREVKSDDKSDKFGGDVKVGEVYIYTEDAKGIAHFENDTANPAQHVAGYVRVTDDMYVNVYDAKAACTALGLGNDESKLYHKVDGYETLTTAFVGYMNNWQNLDEYPTTNWDYTRLADKSTSVIFDITELDRDDTTCPTTTLRDGQKAVVVFDRDMVIRAAFVMEKYDMPDMDDTSLSSVTFKGVAATAAQIEQAAGASASNAPIITISKTDAANTSAGYENIKVVTNDAGAQIGTINCNVSGTDNTWVNGVNNAPLGAVSGYRVVTFTVTSSDGTDSTTYTFRLDVLSSNSYTVKIDGAKKVVVTSSDNSDTSTVYWTIEVQLADKSFMPVRTESGTLSGGTVTDSNALTAGNVYRVTVYDKDPTDSTATQLAQREIAAY